MTDLADLRQSSRLTAINQAAIRPPRTAARTYTAGGREFTVLLASGVAISAWALFPSSVESGIYVPLPETSSSAADADSPTEGSGGAPVNAYRLINTNEEPFDPLSKQTRYWLETASYSSPAVSVSRVPLRSKLQALLLMLHSSEGTHYSAALEAKLRALLKLPDSVLAQLMDHPDLVDLEKMLDAALLGTSDLAAVKTELDRIEVTSVPGKYEHIEVVKVDDKPAYIVRTPATQKGTENAPGSPVSAAQPSGEPVTVTVLSQFDAPAGLTAFTFALPSSAPLPQDPAPTGEVVSTFALAPSSEPLPGAPAPTFTEAPSSEPPAPPSASATPSSSPEPTGIPQTSEDVMTSGNKFEPGEVATTPGGGNSSESQTAVPSSTPTNQEGPAETGGGDPNPPGNEEGGGTPSSSAG